MRGYLVHLGIKKLKKRHIQTVVYPFCFQNEIIFLPTIFLSYIILGLDPDAVQPDRNQRIHRHQKRNRPKQRRQRHPLIPLGLDIWQWRIREWRRSRRNVWQQRNLHRGTRVAGIASRLSHMQLQ
jgi:hypothetical protein